MKTVLILGANSDVAKEAMVLYVQRGYKVVAASRSVEEIGAFVAARGLKGVEILHWDAVVLDRKSTRLNSSHNPRSRMPSSA